MTELLVVITVVGVLLAFLLPAVFRMRESARESVCKNNIRQIDLALIQYLDLNKHIPLPAEDEKVGGWMVELLPFLEQQARRDTISTGDALDTLPASIVDAPSIYRCPQQSLLREPVEHANSLAHYVLKVKPKDIRRSAVVFDAPLKLDVPWVTSPETTADSFVELDGPHRGGYHYVRDGAVQSYYKVEDIRKFGWW